MYQVLSMLSYNIFMYIVTMGKRRDKVCVSVIFLSNVSAWYVYVVQ